MSLQVLNDAATNNKPVEVTKTSPCPHCSKPDWCYSIGELTVCNRDAEPAFGWERTSEIATASHTTHQPQLKNRHVPKVKKNTFTPIQKVIP